MQDHKGISNAAPADAPLRSIPISKAESHSGHETGTDGAEARINDYIDNLRFCISPTAFFQVRIFSFFSLSLSILFFFFFEHELKISQIS